MRGRKPELKALDGGLTNAPPLPETLPSSMSKEWAELAADLVGRGLLDTSGLSVLETYVGAVWMARECRKAIAETGPLVRNKDGALRPNPAGAMLAKANEIIARLADELGISPGGRSRPAIRKQAQDAAEKEDPFAEFDV